MSGKTSLPFATTIQIDNTVRDDIVRLAKLEAKHLGIRHVSIKDYVTMLVNKEKIRQTTEQSH